jgi:hypothetical protein
MKMCFQRYTKNISALSRNIFEKVDSILFNLEFSVSVIYILKIFIV